MDSKNVIFALSLYFDIRYRNSKNGNGSFLKKRDSVLEKQPAKNEVTTILCKPNQRLINPAVQQKL